MARRVLIKLSGEALSGPRGFGFDNKVLDRFVEEIREAHELGVQIAVVVGGGNFLRGEELASQGRDRVAADYQGMLATIINAMTLKEHLLGKGLRSAVLSALIQDDRVCEFYTRDRALEHLENGRVVFLAGGTGNPYFSTDSAAALRASEMSVEVLLKATKVDGVYDRDPKIHADAVKYERVSYTEALNRNLKVMDGAAIAICRENRIPIRVFNFNRPHALRSLLKGDDLGTLVEEE